MSFIDKVIAKTREIAEIKSIQEYALSYEVTKIETSIKINNFNLKEDINNGEIKMLCDKILTNIKNLNTTLNLDLQKRQDKANPNLIDIYADLLAHFAIFKEVFILHAFRQLVQREQDIKKKISEIYITLQINSNSKSGESLIDQLESLKTSLAKVITAEAQLKEKDATLHEILKITAGILDDTVVKSVGQLNPTSNSNS